MTPDELTLVARGWESQNEEFDYDLEVEGEIPQELRGTFYRNGPGRMEVYETKLAHPIDGDGMITAITFNGGKAHFKSKYVKTAGYEIEEKEKRAVMKGMMGTVPAHKTWGEWFDEFKKDVTRGRFPNLRFKNPSNTSVYHWGGKLMSVWEGGMPYSLDPRTLETNSGRENLGGSLEGAKSLAAHGRYDKDKDVMVTFGLQPNIVAKSKLFIFEYDRNWKVVAEKVVELESYWYCHDIMITPNYYLVHHSPFSSLDAWTVAQVASGVKAPGQMMHYYPKIPCRIIVIPRAPDSTEHVRHLDIDPCHIYHHLNAFEEDGHIRFSSVTIGKKFNMEFENKMWLSNFSTEPGRVSDFDIDLATGKISYVQSDECACEFPTHHPDFDGKKWRYGYLMAAEAGYDNLPFADVIKYDREKTGRQRWSSREEHGAIGEPVFVPREGGTEEDDGWVLVQVYYYREHKTQIVVLDAKDLAKGPIARLKLAHHTPFTFHGTFCPEIY